jgi:hypothetical protein
MRERRELCSNEPEAGGQDAFGDALEFEQQLLKVLGEIIAGVADTSRRT